MLNLAKQHSSRKSGRKRASMLALVLGLAATSLAGTAAQAATKITLIADRAKIVRIAGDVSSVIVGNPAFADVSIQKKYLIVHGRNFGQTNILVLDPNGEILADMNITVIKGPDRNISIFRAGMKASYACAPTCESTLQVGDGKEYFKEVHQAISTKMGLAQSAGKLTTK